MVHNCELFLFFFVCVGGPFLRSENQEGYGKNFCFLLLFRRCLPKKKKKIDISDLVLASSELICFLCFFLLVLPVSCFLLSVHPNYFNYFFVVRKKEGLPPSIPDLCVFYACTFLGVGTFRELLFALR